MLAGRWYGTVVDKFIYPPTSLFAIDGYFGPFHKKEKIKGEGKPSRLSITEFLQFSPKFMVSSFSYDTGTGSVVYLPFRIL